MLDGGGAINPGRGARGWGGFPSVVGRGRLCECCTVLQQVTEDSDTNSDSLRVCALIPGGTTGPENESRMLRSQRSAAALRCVLFCFVSLDEEEGQSQGSCENQAGL